MKRLLGESYGRTGLIASLLACQSAILTGGCSSTVANRDPTGQTFPTVKGQSLEKQRKEIPSDLAGRPAVLLVGYKQSAQFDIDRWLLGIIQARVDARIVEIPTIPGLMPTIASNWIDDGMRSGIPKEDWGSVITLYGDSAKPVADLTGTENGQLARVLVLDAEGRIVWFDDKGYSARKAASLAEFVADFNDS